MSGELSSFVLESLRGLDEIIQFGQGKRRTAQMNERSDALAADEKRMKNNSGRNTAVTNTVILVFDMIMLFTAAHYYNQGLVDCKEKKPIFFAIFFVKRCLQR